MNRIDIIDLTRDLIRFDTCNPPGNEKAIAEFCGTLLSQHGFAVKYIPFADDRLNVIAEKGISASEDPIVLTGHFDTVPPGQKAWQEKPFGGDVHDGKVYGRGSSGMKSGLAALICAAIGTTDSENPPGGVRLVLTASEEIGCQGARQLVGSGQELGKARALVVAEPTGNIPVTGHKGALFVNATTTGVTAHSSMPELGVNAVYKAARAITRIEKMKFDVPEDPLLGMPTVNVGMIRGGMNANSVPDHAAFTIDIRTTTRLATKDAFDLLKDLIVREVSLESFVDLNAVFTAESDPFIQLVYQACGISSEMPGFPKALPYVTDGAVLQPYYNDVPTVILGPGEAEQAHQTDEFCYVEKVKSAVEIYTKIISGQEV